ncbi:N-acetyltransferase [Flavobacterium silvisoli]|uniref:N-acetyltransferase n=1 Tax=Flavobacterium silvisoli TaxID=2529433 RepID=A0A4Q9Z1H0_9FLAO|nr:GNAT family protein [Flavobacterium silvisoli]TBX70176.1 N-acetyltransferase [Flavobacterium silvisoli]
MSPFETLSTERLLLRKLTPEIFDYVYNHFSDEDLMEFIGAPNEEALSKEKEKHRKGLSTFNKSFCYFQILDKTNQQIIGWCGYHTWYLDHKRAEIGYGLFDDSYKQKGLMSEATKVILDYGFNQMNLNRIEAFIGKENKASLNLVKKFGFTQEGILREHYFNKNCMEDSVVYSLLRREYNS